MAIISNAVTIADAGAFQASLGSLVHIKTLTASSSANLSFVHGTADVVLDSTYPIYKFIYLNLHPSANEFAQFNMSTDGGSNYNVSKTTTNFNASQGEGGEFPGLNYQAGNDLANSTAYQVLSFQPYTENDSSISGELTLYNPSSTVFVKHFMAKSQSMHANSFAIQTHVAGYCNTTSAVDAVNFQFSSGNIDTGTIKLYGIKDS